MLKQFDNANPVFLTIYEDYLLDSLHDVLSKHFLGLSNEIADNLFIYEILYQNLFEMLKKSKENSENLDRLAEKIDNLFYEQKVHLHKSLKNIISTFCSEVLLSTKNAQV